MNGGGTPRNDSILHAVRPVNAWRVFLCLGILLAGGAVVGCGQRAVEVETSSRSLTLPALAALGTDVGGAIVAQGKLEPSGGVLPIMAPVGDRVTTVTVSAGQSVEKGEELGRLLSLDARLTELAVAETQLDEAKKRFAAEQAIATAKLEVAKVEFKLAELGLRQAEASFARAEASGGRFDLLRHGVELSQRKLEQLRQASGDRATVRLVSPSTLEQQDLEVSQARARWESARQEAIEAIESGKLKVLSAQKELQTAELTIRSAVDMTPFRSLEQQVSLLRLRAESSRLASPVDGVVLSVDVAEGEATTGAPLMYIADTSAMVCVAEVNVADLPTIEMGAECRISSPALPRPLVGTVRSISRMIGPPALPSPYPMARVDWRSSTVVIDIDSADTEASASLINLQTDVAIRSSPKLAADSKP